MNLLLSFIKKKKEKEKEKHDVWERNVIDCKRLSSHLMDIGSVLLSDDVKQKDEARHTQ